MENASHQHGDQPVSQGVQLPFLKVVLQKVDLDTCATGLVLNVDRLRDVLIVAGRATPLDLSDPWVLCIETGGSGLAHLNNFDHHEPGMDLPPACRQAFDHVGTSDETMSRLVEYVSRVDLALPMVQPIAFPSLSNVFSGMLLTIHDPVLQFQAGMGMMREVLRMGLDPFQPMPELPHWSDFLAAKQRNAQRLEQDLARAQIFVIGPEIRVGLLETNAAGGSGRLFAMGCDVAVLYARAFAAISVHKCTIISRRWDVSGLLPELERLEPGWGGRKQLIGSPWPGTRLGREVIMEIVVRHYSQRKLPTLSID